MNNKHRKTLKAVFAYPMLGVIECKAVETLLVAVGAKMLQGRGSRVRFVNNKIVVTFHRPHPEKMQSPTRLGTHGHFWKP